MIVVYNSTGAITRLIGVPDNEAIHNVAAGETYLLTTQFVTDDTHWVSNGQLVPYSEGMRVAKLTPQKNGVVWEPSNGGWVDKRSLDEKKQDAWSTAKSHRDIVESGGLYWKGMIFDSDQESRTRIMEAVQLASIAIANSQEFSREWTMANNETVALDGEEMIELGVALGARVAEVHSAFAALREAILGSVTDAVLDSLDLTAGMTKVIV